MSSNNYEKINFTFPSSDGIHEINAVRFIPTAGKPKGILQISHGMVEYIDRYDDFAAFLASAGFIVTGNDHLGHGASVKSRDEWGYFSENGALDVLNDLHTLTSITKELYPDLPYFLLGHSMGSFFARRYLFTYGSELNGAIIMGTGYQPGAVVSFGVALTAVLAKIKGSHYRSEFVNSLAFGSYNKPFEPGRTPKDWLSKNPENVDKYLAEERCSFLFTLNGYHHMFKTLLSLTKKDNLEKMPKELPVLFVSGKNDPVGDMGRGVTRVASQFKKHKMLHVGLKLYDDDRHEILNEADNGTVYCDILKWMIKHL